MSVWLGYTRVSRVGDRAETLISPELQAARIDAYAKGRGLSVEHLEPELDVSGGQASRPVLDEAIERVRCGEAAGIIVAQLDRLSRMDITDALRTIRRIGDDRVIAVAENFDAATPEGRLARNMFLAVGQLQLDRYKASFAAAKRQAVERGIWPMPIVPIGYSLGEDRRLVVCRDSAPRVLAAFEARAAGEPWRVVGELLDRGDSGARKVIRNRVYLGEVRLRVGGESVVCRRAHEAIVTPALFEAAQLRAPRPARRGNPPALLAGILRCAGCRCAMSPVYQRGFRGYRCTGRQKAGGRCREPALVAASSVEPYVEQVALDAIGALRAAGSADELVGEANERLVAAEAELEAFQAATAAAEVGAEHFASGMRRRVGEVEAARRELAAARLRAPAGVEHADLRSLWASLDVEQRRHLLRSAVGVAWVWKGRGVDVAQRVRVIAAGYEPQDLPGPGFGRSQLRPVARDADLPGEIGPKAAQ